MKRNITNLFDKSGKSLNGKVQLELYAAEHNCHPDPEYRGYGQITTVLVRDNGIDPVEIVSYDDDFDNEIVCTVFWQLTNADAEEDADACDWSTFEVFAQDQGYDLETLFGE